MSRLPSYSRSGYVIALINQKGGVGKSTTTVNLGSVWQSKAKKSCLLMPTHRQM